MTRNQGYSQDCLRSIKVPPFRGFNHALRISEGFWITIFARGFSLTWDNQRKAFCAERRIVNDSPKRWEILYSPRPFVAWLVSGAMRLTTLLI